MLAGTDRYRMVGADRKAIVVSASSDIGTAMCRRWLARGWTVAGTYRVRDTTERGT
jgi:NAD(P)-dependent dehydrogenase (short-subunit alcohol dehydrogenase family)